MQILFVKIYDETAELMISMKKFYTWLLKMNSNRDVWTIPS